MKRTPTVFLQVVLVLIGISVLGFLLLEPQLEGVNVHATNFQIYFQDPFIVLVYLGSIPFFMALYQAFMLLRLIERNNVFSLHSVKALRAIKYCAMAIIGFIAAEETIILFSHGDDDAAGVFMLGIVISFGSVVIATAAAVFQKLLQSAVDMKSENDLTV